MTVSTAGLLPTEDEAAALEGVLPMPADLVEDRERMNTLREQRDALTAAMEEIKERFSARLEADGAQGYVLNGRVHARRSEVTTTRVNGAELKRVMPDIWRRFVTTTKSVRITIS